LSQDATLASPPLNEAPSRAAVLITGGTGNTPSANCQPTVSVAGDHSGREALRRPPTTEPDSDASRGDGELMPLRQTSDDDEVRLEPPRLEPLTAAQEAQAAELLAALLAAAASRRAKQGPLKEAA
jgi:hypothetical protein